MRDRSLTSTALGDCSLKPYRDTTILCRVPAAEDFSATKLAILRIDGTGERVIATDLAQWCGCPFAWSLDGTRVAYVTSPPMAIVAGANKLAMPAPPRGRRPRPAEGIYGVYVLNLRDGSRHLLDQWLPWAIAWAPDGRFVAGVEDSVVVRAADGSGKARILVPHAGLVFSWSTQNEIAFWSHEDHSIMVARDDGSNVRSLVVLEGEEAGVGPGDIAWSPDGELLAFTVNNNNAPGPLLYVVDRKGEHRRRILATGDTWAKLWGVSWSYDGHYILTTESMRPEGTARVVRRDGRCNQFLPKSDCAPAGAAWSPSPATPST